MRRLRRACTYLYPTLRSSPRSPSRQPVPCVRSFVRSFVVAKPPNAVCGYIALSQRRRHNESILRRQCNATKSFEFFVVEGRKEIAFGDGERFAV